MSKQECRKNDEWRMSNESARFFVIRHWVFVIVSSFVIWNSTLLATPVAESTVLQQQGPATLSVRAKVERGQVSMRLADSLLLTLTIDGSSELEVTPASLQASEVIKVRGQPAPLIMPNGKDRLRWQQTFHLEPLVPGNHAIQIEPLEYREKPGEWKKVTWRPVSIKVTTQVKSADAEDIRDITDIEELRSRPSPWIWVYWSLGGVGGLILLLVGFHQWRKRRRHALPTLSPEQWAAREMERVMGLNLPARGEVERFHTMLSNVVRRYLEKRFALPARRQTTPEFLQTMQHAPQLSADQQALVRGFLERCDLAKFANAQVSVEECTATAEMVANFLDKSSHT